jgi:hypothetical protein
VLADRAQVEPLLRRSADLVLEMLQTPERVADLLFERLPARER